MDEEPKIAFHYPSLFNSKDLSVVWALVTAGDRLLQMWNISRK